MRKVRKKSETIFNRKVKYTSIGNWKYFSLVFIYFFSLALLFTVLTYLAGFDEVKALQIELINYDVKTSDLLVHDLSESTQSGLSNKGTFAVIHEVVISNEDDVAGEFTVVSTISKGSDDSVMSEKATLAAGRSYTFTFQHDRAWVIGEFDAKYEVDLPRKMEEKIEGVSSEEVVTEHVWTWPWPFRFVRQKLGF